MKPLKVLDIIIRFVACLPLTICLFPFYATGYIIGNLFKIGEYEDMPSLIEWSTAWCNFNCTVIYPFYIEMENEI